MRRDLGKYLGYVNKDCPNCGRHRVEGWSSGIEICEKCNWCIQDNNYYTADEDEPEEDLWFHRLLNKE